MPVSEAVAEKLPQYPKVLKVSRRRRHVRTKKEKKCDKECGHLSLMKKNLQTLIAARRNENINNFLQSFLAKTPSPKLQKTLKC